MHIKEKTSGIDKLMLLFLSITALRGERIAPLDCGAINKETFIADGFT